MIRKINDFSLIFVLAASKNETSLLKTKEENTDSTTVVARNGKINITDSNVNLY